MSSMIVTPGDTITRIAAAAGLAPETVWSHPANAEVKASRDHMDVLATGDHLVVPECTAKTLPCATGMRHRFRRPGVPMRFVLQLLDAWGQPRKDRPFQLIVDGAPMDGRTDGNGVLRVYLPTDARSAVLHLDDLELAVAFGELEPKSALLGAQQRLTNLGFECLGDGGKMGRDTALALLRFQRMVGLEGTGKLDDTTRAALDAHHQQQGKLMKRLAGEGSAL